MLHCSHISIEGLDSSPPQAQTENADKVRACVRQGGRDHIHQEWGRLWYLEKGNDVFQMDYDIICNTFHSVWPLFIARWILVLINDSECNVNDQMLMFCMLWVYVQYYAVDLLTFVTFVSTSFCSAWQTYINDVINTKACNI